MRYRERSNLATRQTRNPFGGVNRSLTGCAGRIASNMCYPVYPRQDDKDDERSEGRKQAQAADLLQRGRRPQRHLGISFRRGRHELHEHSIMSNKMWGGRFGSGPDPIMEDINASIDFDQKLYRQDIAASKAHAAMLAKKGIITAQDAKRIAHGLDTILSEIETGKFAFKRALEDIHMNVESRLAELIGPAAGRLHTARSRNDQVATDFRLWLRQAIDEIDVALTAYQRALARKSLDHAATVMPGLTHLQPAQPVTFGHHLLAYVEMAARDRGRFADARRRLNECPLGSGALAGTSFPIDRAMTAKALGFTRPTANSLDAVADRDFVLETLSACAITAVHLSRLAAERPRSIERQVHHRLVDDAAEAQSGRGGAHPCKDWPGGRCADGIAGRAQGIAARLSEGSPGGQRGRDRRDRRARIVAHRDDRHGGRHAAGRRAHGGSGRRGLFDRHRSRRLAGAGAPIALPGGASPYRADRC